VVSVISAAFDTDDDIPEALESAILTIVLESIVLEVFCRNWSLLMTDPTKLYVPTTTSFSPALQLFSDLTDRHLFSTFYCFIARYCSHHV
jgi:hypothetical protein